MIMFVTDQNAKPYINLATPSSIENIIQVFAS